MTLLSICQNAALLIGLPKPTSIISNSDRTAEQLLNLANLVGREIRDYPQGQDAWSVLMRPHEITTVNGQAEYDLPTDYLKFIDQTAWDRTNYWSMRGSLSPSEWQQIKSGLIQSTDTDRQFRVKRSETAATFASKIFIDPTPSSADTLVIEYVSKNWLTNAAQDTGYTEFQVDTDLPLFDEDLMLEGIVSRWKQSKGYDYLIDLTRFEQSRDAKLAADKPAMPKQLGRPPRVLPPGNVPDTGFGT